METLNRPSFNEIGEMTCITHAWLSPGETLKSTAIEWGFATFSRFG